MDFQSAANTEYTTLATTSSVPDHLSRLVTFDPSSTDFYTFAKQIESAIEHSLHAYLPRMIEDEINKHVENKLLRRDGTRLQEEVAKDFARETLDASWAHLKDVTDYLQSTTTTPSTFTVSVDLNEADGASRVYGYHTTHVYFRPFWEVQVSAGWDEAQSTRQHGSEWFQGPKMDLQIDTDWSKRDRRGRYRVTAGISEAV